MCGEFWIGEMGFNEPKGPFNAYGLPRSSPFREAGSHLDERG